MSLVSGKRPRPALSAIKEREPFEAIHGRALASSENFQMLLRHGGGAIRQIADLPHRTAGEANRDLHVVVRVAPAKILGREGVDGHGHRTGEELQGVDEVPDFANDPAALRGLLIPTRFGEKPRIYPVSDG